MNAPESDLAPAEAADAISHGITRVRRDAELAAGGWVRRFIGSPPKLKEQAELYEALGYEVLLDPVSDEELAEACAGCALALALFRVIYTRKST
jgi:hypothetical protein